MDLSKIISVSGQPGLYKVIAQGKAGLIVESLSDKKRMPVQANYKISVLDNISIYVNSGDTIPLSDLLRKMFEKSGGQPGPDSKGSDEELKKFFEAALPEYDKEKVHSSDIKKAVMWYNLLQKTDIFTTKEESSKEEGVAVSEEKKPTFSHENQGKHMNAHMNAPKKTVGVRKTGTA